MTRRKTKTAKAPTAKPFPWEGKWQAKLTPEITAKVLEGIELGLHPEQACMVAGIAPRTLRLWKQKGEQHVEPYESFLEAFQAAEAEAERGLLSLAKAGIRRMLIAHPPVALAGGGQKNQEPSVPDARSALELLGRRWPSRWASTQRTQQLPQGEATPDAVASANRRRFGELGTPRPLGQERTTEPTPKAPNDAAGPSDADSSGDES